MKLEPALLKQLVRAVMGTHDDEIDCGECFEQLARFVEMALAGKDVSQAMPLTHDHLQRCSDCREEFEALLKALQALESTE